MNKGILYGVGSACSFSTYALINRYAFVNYDINSTKYILVFITIYGFIAGTDLLRSLKITKGIIKSSHFKKLAFLAFISTASIAIFVAGQEFTTAANAGLISPIVILTTAFFSWVVLREVLSLKQGFWIGMLLLGIYVSIVGFNIIDLNKGDVIVLISLVPFGYANVLTKQILADLKALEVANFRMFLGGFATLLIGLVLYGFDMFNTGAGIYPYVNGVLSWLMIVLFYKGIKECGPVKATVLNMLHPIITIIGAYFFLSESITTLKLVGGFMVLLSVAMYSREGAISSEVKAS